MNEQEFKKRTKQLALRIINLVNSLPKKTAAQVNLILDFRFWILDFLLLKRQGFADFRLRDFGKHDYTI